MQRGRKCEGGTVYNVSIATVKGGPNVKSMSYWSPCLEAEGSRQSPLQLC